MLSRGKSEYSRTMSSYDMPSARHARMNDDERRVPRIVGFPPRRSGFVTRYRNPGIGVSSMSSLLGRPSFPLRSPIQTEVYVPRGPGPDVLRLRHHPAQHLLTIAEYGDTLDIMGIPHAGHFNAFQKECPPPGPTSPWMRPRSTTILTRRRRSPRCGPTAAARGVSVTGEGSARFAPSTSIE